MKFQDKSADASGEDWALYFGGPDKLRGRLRAVLSEMIEQQPPGAHIIWATYYFKDMDLAKDLIRAHRRGVKVHLTLEAQPRERGANQPVISLLKENGLGENLSLHGRGPFKYRGHLHAKIFTFSHPRPSAFIGSYDPSGSTKNDNSLSTKIGDQDRGHNLFYQTFHPGLISKLIEMARLSNPSSLFSRLSLRHNKAHTYDDKTLYLFPRLKNAPASNAIKDITSNTIITGAISHMSSNPLIPRLIEASSQGASINIVVHATERRVPENVVSNMQSAGINIFRYYRGVELPMHAKFLLIKTGTQTQSWLGSYNHNSKSRWMNHEVLLKSHDPQLYEALEARFKQIVDKTNSARESRSLKISHNTPLNMGL